MPMPLRSSLARHRDPSSINPPRHDYMAKLTGDAVHDVASNFAERWNFVKQTDSITTDMLLL